MIFKFYQDLENGVSYHLEPNPAPDAGGIENEGSADPQGGEPPPQNEFNPNDYPYVFRGETTYPQSKEELTELMQLGHSYRTNRTKFDEERASFQQTMGQYEKYKNLEAALQENPQFAQEMWGVYEKFQNGGNNDAPPSDPILQELQTKVLTMEERQADADLKREMNDLKKSHPEYDWDKDTGDGSLSLQLLRFMHKNRIVDSELAFRAFMFPTAMKNAQFDAKKATTQNIQRSNRAGVVANSSAGAPPAKQFDPRGKSYDQAAEAAIASLNQ